MAAASRALLIAMIVAAAVAPAFAVDHIVGDNKGWNAGFRYDVWAEGQDFHVGDSLTFMYTRGDHNVIMVNASEFQGCTYSNATSKIWSSGFDVLPLAPGEQWYISGKQGDCYEGMRLAITVFATQEPAPAPMIPGSSAPPPGASAAGQVVSPMRSCVWWVLAFMAAYMWVLVAQLWDV